MCQVIYMNLFINIYNNLHNCYSYFTHKRIKDQGGWAITSSLHSQEGTKIPDSTSNHRLEDRYILNHRQTISLSKDGDLTPDMTIPKLRLLKVFKPTLIGMSSIGHLVTMSPRLTGFDYLIRIPPSLGISDNFQLSL